MNSNLKQWLHARHITDDVITSFHLSSKGDTLVIPVQDESGTILFNKYRKSPFVESKAPKYTYDAGAKAQLFGWYQAKDSERIVVCEGELDALVLWSLGIPAVSTTGGSSTWNKEWTELLSNKEVFICYDNDVAGCKGAVRLLSEMPHARVVLVPDRGGVKDMTDFVVSGGDVQRLLRSARTYTSLTEVEDDRTERSALYKPILFHDTYIAVHKTVAVARPRTRKPAVNGDALQRAKAVPIDTLIRFVGGKAKCIWHEEKTASLIYYRKTNTVHCFGCGKGGDSIDVYRALHACTFNQAIKKLS